MSDSGSAPLTKKPHLCDLRVIMMEGNYLFMVLAVQQIPGRNEAKKGSGPYVFYSTNSLPPSSSIVQVDTLPQFLEKGKT